MTGHSIPYIRAELQLDSVGLKKKTKNARTFNLPNSRYPSMYDIITSKPSCASARFAF